MHMYSLLQIVIQKNLQLFENTNLYDLIDKSQHLIIKCLHTIGSQQEISTPKDSKLFVESTIAHN
jgi:hypothetical protein